MKKLRRIVSVVVLMALVANLTAPAAKANSDLLYEDIIFIDGVEYNVSVDFDGNVCVEGEMDDTSSSMQIDSNGNGTVVLDSEDETLEEYKVEIEELNKDDVEVEILDENDKILEEYNDYEELVEDTYEPQVLVEVTIFAEIVYLILCLIATTAIMYIGNVCYIMAKEFCKSIAKASAKQKQRSLNSYYPAYIKSYVTYISTKDISLKEAAARLLTIQNIYTYYSANAKKAVLQTGYSPKGPEIHTDSEKVKGKYVFYHYHPGHTNSKNVMVKSLDSHALYGDAHYVS